MTWSTDAIEKVVDVGKFVEASNLFKQFRKEVLASSPQDVEANSGKATMVWEFLFGFCKAKRMYRKQVVECANVLLECAAFSKAYVDSEKLVAMMQTLPDDVQAAFAEQATGYADEQVIMKSIAPAAMRLMQSHAVVKDEQKSQVAEDIKQFREAEQEKQALISELDEEAGDVPQFNSGAGQVGGAKVGYIADTAPKAPQQLPSQYELLDGIQACLEITNPIQMENAGIPAFAKLRKGCLHHAGEDAVFEAEADYAVPILQFLIDFANKNRIRLRQTLEVLHLLMASDAWAAAYTGSPVLQERVSSELPDEIQAAFGMAHPQIMMSLAPKVQQTKVDGDLQKVKGQMDKLRRAGVNVENDAPPPPPAPKDEGSDWKESRAPGTDAVYYYNIRTRKSQWSKPACLGGPKGYAVGDLVEVYSNSKRTWCAGKIVEVKEAAVVAEFAVPGAEGVAKKELPSDHQHIRHKEEKEKTVAAVSLTAAEEKTYKPLFDHCTKGTKTIPGSFMARFMAHSGLPRRTLKEIWGVSNPDLKKDISWEEFGKSCRLVGHCQAIDVPEQSLLVEGGSPLKKKLESFLSTPPPKMPDFQRQSSSQ